MNRGRQVIRQLKLLQILERSRRGLSADAVHDALDEGCSKRTVYRDLEQLKRLEFLVEESGCWKIFDGLRIELPLEPTQLLALLLAEEALEPLQGSPIAQSLSELRSRLTTRLTPVGREWLRACQDSVVGTQFAPSRYGAHSLMVEMLLEAIHLEQPVAAVYRSRSSGRTERVLEPYFMWYHSGRYYIVAWCRSRQAYRDFAIQRFEAVEMLDETFERDPDFDTARFVKRGFGVFHGAVHDVVIEFHDEVAYLFEEREFHATQRVAPIEGGVRVSFRMAGMEEVATWVVGFGGRARPVTPPELVERVRWLHAEGLRALSSGRVVTSDVTST